MDIFFQLVSCDMSKLKGRLQYFTIFSVLLFNPPELVKVLRSYDIKNGGNIINLFLIHKTYPNFFIF